MKKLVFIFLFTVCNISLQAQYNQNNEIVLLEIEGIKGEYNSFLGKNLIPLTSYSFSAYTQNLNQDSLSFYGASDYSNYNYISITKAMDMVSPQLLSKCMNGEKIAKAVLKVWNINDTSNPIFIIEMKNCSLQNVSITGGGSYYTSSESMNINYEEIKWEYTKVVNGEKKTSTAMWKKK